MISYHKVQYQLSNARVPKSYPFHQWLASHHSLFPLGWQHSQESSTCFQSDASLIHSRDRKLSDLSHDFKDLSTVQYHPCHHLRYLSTFPWQQNTHLQIYQTPICWKYRGCCDLGKLCILHGKPCGHRSAHQALSMARNNMSLSLAPNKYCLIQIFWGQFLST